MLGELCRYLLKESFVKYLMWVMHVQLLTLRRKASGAYTPVLTTVCTPDHTAANNAFVNAVLRTGASRSPHQPNVRIGTVELLRVGSMEADRVLAR